MTEHLCEPSDLDQIWQVIEAQRHAVADLLAGLSEEEWARPSLCSGWTVRDVAAHLTLQQLRPRDAVGVMLRWRGTMNRTIRSEARRRAAWPTDRLVAEIRDTAGVRRPNAGVTPKETLIDILVHGQDIAVPLGRPLATPPEAAALAATRVLSMRWPPPLPSVRAVAPFRLVATDVSWTAGPAGGPEIHGPVAALLLVCTGRRAGLAALSGPGLRRLEAALPV